MSRSYIFCMFVKVFPKGIQNFSEIISFKALGQITNSSNIMANLFKSRSKVKYNVIFW